MTAGKSIESAAIYINNTLIAKGFLEQDEKIIFPSLNKQVETNHEQVTNDTRIINVIYGLLDSMNHDDESNDTQTRKIRQLEQDIEREIQAKNKALKSIKSTKEALVRAEQINSSLESSLRLANINHSTTKDAYSRLKVMAGQQKAQFANELRRRDVELTAIKRRLRDPKELKIHSGVSGKLSKYYNSYKSVGHELEKGNDEQIKRLNDEIISVNNRLIDENHLLSQALHDIRLSLTEYQDSTNYLQEFDFDGQSLDSAGVAKRIIHEEQMTNQIKNGINELYQAISDPNYISVDEMAAKDKQIEQLETQLNEATTNWKKALQTMDQWKSYRASRASNNKINSSRSNIKSA